jgi:alpha-N-acetylglucosaminidase
VPAHAPPQNFYLKNYLHSSLSWTGDNLQLPAPSALPQPATTVRKPRTFVYSYYQNVCTVSYSMAWWTWERWERELDWMGKRAALA